MTSTTLTLSVLVSIHCDGDVRVVGVGGEGAAEPSFVASTEWDGGMDGGRMVLIRS